MTIKNDMHFIFDGQRSTDYGIINVVVSASGMQEEGFVADHSVIEESIPYNDIPYYKRTEKTPFTLNLQLAFVEDFSEEKLRKVAKWLTGQSFYKELYFSKNIDKRYFVKYIGSSSLVHNNINQGYINITFRSIGPYTYSPVLTEGPYDIAPNSTGVEFVFNNKGDMNSYPLIEIEKIGNGSIEIINYSGIDNVSFKLNNLSDGEFITVDSETEDIVSNLPENPHFDDMEGKFMILTPYNNYIKVIGGCKISFKYRSTFSLI